MLLHVHQQRAQQAREFLDGLRHRITTAELWPSSRTQILAASSRITARKPDVAITLAFTFYGLLALGVPIRTLRGMPDAFQEGMLKRAAILRDLHDLQQTLRDLWDFVWVAELDHSEKRVHILITLNAKAAPEHHPSAAAALEASDPWLVSCCGEGRGISILSGHRGSDPDYQDMAVLSDPVKEHVRFTDGIGDPVFEGQYADALIMANAVVGQG
ncbi:MAG: hypothetical protein VKK97_05780 [Synechococcaceae cyanobacterium]|nr:hypothetical protein [Synechococcaceae cyanobacterium]